MSSVPTLLTQPSVSDGPVSACGSGEGIRARGQRDLSNIDYSSVPQCLPAPPATRGALDSSYSVNAVTSALRVQRRPTCPDPRGNDRWSGSCAVKLSRGAADRGLPVNQFTTIQRIGRYVTVVVLCRSPERRGHSWTGFAYESLRGGTTYLPAQQGIGSHL